MANFKDTDLMPYGKYKGIAMANVPASYLDWIRRTWILTKQNAPILGYIQDNRQAIEQELKKEQEAKNKT